MGTSGRRTWASANPTSRQRRKGGLYVLPGCLVLEPIIHPWLLDSLPSQLKNRERFFLGLKGSWLQPRQPLSPPKPASSVWETQQLAAPTGVWRSGPHRVPRPPSPSREQSLDT